MTLGNPSQPISDVTLDNPSQPITDVTLDISSHSITSVIFDSSNPAFHPPIAIKPPGWYQRSRRAVFGSNVTPPAASSTSSRSSSLIDDDLANAGYLNEEIVTLIIDAMLEDDAMRHHRSFECPMLMKHYPLFRLRPHSEGTAKLCLVSKHMRHMVLSKLYRTLRFHGGGAQAQDDWDMFNAHMTIKDTPQVHLSQPKIYIR
jgi:hypothetical protein